MENDRIFLNSLDALTPDDIAPEPPVRKKKTHPGTVILYVLLCFFIAVFIFSAISIATYFIDEAGIKSKYKDDVNLNKMSAILAKPSETDDGTDGTAGSRIPPLSVIEPVTDGTDSPSVTQPSDTDTPGSEPSDTEPMSGTVTETEAPLKEPPVTEPQHSDRFLALQENLLSLREKNQDIIGFISIPSLNINYPLLQRREDVQNSYYLTHAYDGTETKAGSIFVDFRCRENLLSNFNTIIYGHNMRSGTMFGTLPKVFDSEELFRNTEIIIATLDGIYTYKLFAAYRTTIAYDYCRTAFNTDSEFTGFCDAVQAKSSFNGGGLEFYGSDRILTLSTCTNLTTRGRFAFHAVLTEIEY